MDRKDSSIAIDAGARPEEAAASTAHRLQTLFDASPDLVLVLDVDGRILDANATVQRVCGYSRAEVLSRSIHELMGGDCTAEQARARIREVIDGQAPDFEWTGRRRDGGTFPVEVRLRRLPDAEPDPGRHGQVLAILRDVSEARRAEAALRAQEAMFRALVEQSVVGIYIVQDGHFVYMNPRMLELLGYPPGADPGPVPIEAVIDPQDLPRVRRNVGERLAGRPLATRYPIGVRRRDGSRLEAEVQSALTEYRGRPALIGAGVDVTERVRAERALQRLAERLRVLTELDRGILGAQPEEALAASALHDLRRLLPADYGAVLAHLEGEDELVCIAADGPGDVRPAPGERYPPAACGALVDAESGTPRRYGEEAEPGSEAAAGPRALLRAHGFRTQLHVPLDAGAERIGVLLLAAHDRDAFDAEDVEIAGEAAARLAIVLHHARLHAAVQRQASELEARVAQRTEQLAEANRELETFASSMSHDLRAPLRAMHGFAQALLEDYGAGMDETARGYARRILAGAGRLDRLIQDLLEYARVGRREIPLRGVDLAALTAEVLEEISADVRERGAAVAVAAPLPVVRGDRSLLRQVLLNLLGNALKFVTPGVAPRIRVSAQCAAGRARLWVEDNGIGLAEEYRERIFRPFERLHGVEAYPGSGLGLAVVRKAMLRMEGRCGVEAGAGGGSRFWIELALWEENDGEPGVHHPAGGG